MSVKLLRASVVPLVADANQLSSSSPGPSAPPTRTVQALGVSQLVRYAWTLATSVPSITMDTRPVARSVPGQSRPSHADGPGGPVSPRSPFAPVAPGSPFGPAGPIAPRSPVAPAAP